MENARYIVDLNDEDIQRMEEWLLTEDGIKVATIVFHGLIGELSVRATNVLRNMFGDLVPSSAFFHRFFRLKGSELIHLPNCGRKTVKEILSFVMRYKGHLYRQLPEVPEYIPEIHDDLKNDVAGSKDLQLLESEVRALTTGLSTRSVNVINVLFHEANNDIGKLYRRISADGFNCMSLNNVGRKSFPEIKRWRESFISLVHDYLEVTGEENELHHSEPEIVKGNQYPVREAETINDRIWRDNRLSKLIPDEASRQTIYDLERSQGYFPFFLAISYAIESNLNDRERFILAKGVRVKDNQIIDNAKEIAWVLSLSRERVIQLRKKLLKSILSYSRAIRKLFQDEPCPYLCLGNDIAVEINTKEGTAFGRDFIHWIIGTVFSEYKSIGDTYHTLTTPFSTVGFIALVPSDLAKVFNFKSFISRLEDVIDNKRNEDRKVSLRTFIEPLFKKREASELYPEVQNACLSIIHLHYNLEIQHGCIALKANAKKSLSDIIYDLIRKEGTPMTQEQLALEIKLLYPERTVSYDNIGSCALKHPKVLAIGRTHTYTLKSWTSGAERGGTIRSFVCEYLDSLKEPIAPEKDVCKYVRQFRPSSSDKSITSNLLQEETHKFAVYEREGVRYIGYMQKNYSPSYTIVAGHRPLKRTVAESMLLLEEFIKTHKRFPRKTNSDEEEARLSRFVEYRRSVCSRKAIPADEIEKWKAFEDKCREYLHSR